MEDKEEGLQFHEMGIDDRILEAICKLGWSQPTPIQEKAIPLALQGKDILARARTGSGKTGAYAVAVIHKLLSLKQTASAQAIRAVILTPSKELCSQTYKNIVALTSGCSRDIKCVDISPQLPLAAQRPMLLEKPDIVVATPSRLLAHIRAENISLKHSLEMLVVDEADLVFSFGYEADVKELLSTLPKIYQAFLMSATLGEDVMTLKKLVLHNAVILKLEESQLPETSQLNQYHIKCEDGDKFALTAALLKLNLIHGKTIFFVNSINRCYLLKLFLEQFGVRACILNAELPVNSRCHIVNQFNDGLYDYIIAADEAAAEPSSSQFQSQQKSKPSRFRKHDKEYGASRGIDFYNVSNVINFDFPQSADAYIHRVGRTARADNPGTALSFVSIKDGAKLQEIEAALVGDTGSQEDSVFKPYNFKMGEIEGFRYRSKDALQAVTRSAIQEARMKDIKQEIFNSSKLKSYFDDNPHDLQALRHDKPLHSVKTTKELKHVPDYIVPPALRKQARRKVRSDTCNHRHSTNRSTSQSGKTFRKRMADPLKSFQFAGLSDAKKKKKQSK